LYHSSGSPSVDGAGKELSISMYDLLVPAEQNRISSVYL